MANEFYKKPEETIEEYYARTPTPDKPGDVITTDDLKPVEDVDFKTPEQPITPTIPAPAPLTPKEQEAETTITDIQKLTQELAGEEAFRAEKAEELGVSALRTTQEDLYTQITNLNTEMERLEHEKGLVAERVAQESEGRRGMGAIQTLTAAEQRKYTLKQSEVASKALTLSAQYNATQGKLGTAERQVEEAVAAKYGAKKAEKAALLENLDLIIASPSYSAETKARAEAEKAKTEPEQKALEEQENFAKEIQGIALSIAASGKSTPALSAQINKILDKEDITFEDTLLVTQLAQQAGIFAAEPAEPMVRTIGDTLYQFNPDTGGWEVAVRGVPTEPGVSEDLMAQRLLDVGLPTNIITTTGGLTKGNKDKITSAGVPPSIVDLITEAILEGDTLEEIRQALKEGHGQETGFRYLDLYMSTIQQGATEEIENPFK